MAEPWPATATRSECPPRMVHPAALRADPHRSGRAPGFGPRPGNARGPSARSCRAAGCFDTSGRNGGTSPLLANRGGCIGGQTSTVYLVGRRPCHHPGTKCRPRPAGPVRVERPSLRRALAHSNIKGMRSGSARPWPREDVPFVARRIGPCFGRCAGQKRRSTTPGASS